MQEIQTSEIPCRRKLHGLITTSSDFISHANIDECIQPEKATDAEELRKGENTLFDEMKYPEAILKYKEAKGRGRTILAGCKGGSVGSYSDSPGLEVIRRHVAGTGTRTRPGIMIPFPQYPLYSASLAEYNIDQVQSI